MTDHLSEAAILQYALDGENCPAWMVGHLRACERCSIRVNNYRMVFKEVEAIEMPPMEMPVMDVAELVLAKLRQEKEDIARAGRPVARKKDRSLVYWMGGAGMVMLAAAWFSRAFLVTIAGDIPSLTVGVAVGVSVGIAIVRCLTLIIGYRHQLKNLDLS
jgi:hypothetical protein